MADLIPPVVAKYEYAKLERIDSPTGRTYRPAGRDAVPVPSVTHILSATKDMEAINAWVERVGQAEADRIKSQAAHVGTQMHHVLECVLAREPLHMKSDELSLRGYEMAFRLINNHFINIQEVWGSEVSLYYPGRYAGTTDFVGIYRRNLAIVDFKQSIKPKRRGHIEDYFCQLAAYALAHDRVHGTNIQFGAVLIAVQDGSTQEYTTTGDEFAEYKQAWMRRLEQYEEKRARE